MSSPTGENAFLYELEIDVTAELAQAEASPPEEEAIAAPVDEWLVDPVDAERYEIGLRNLLGRSRDPGRRPRPSGPRVRAARPRCHQVAAGAWA
jgi:hypothetical protein